MRSCRSAPFLLVVLAVAVANAAPPERTVQQASVVLTEIMAVPVQSIPEALLADAEAVAIFPGVMKVGFVAGVERGRGVVTIRQEDRNWGAPRFVVITGGSVGWQIGASATDLILVFKTRKSVENLLNGKFKIGADIAAAAGPVGRRVEAATDGQLSAEIYSYSRSRGLFAGASIDGALIALDTDSETAFYRTGLDGKAIVPEMAVQLVAAVDRYSVSSSIAPAALFPAAEAEPVDATETLRRDLAHSADRLTGALDGSWKQYLALPADVYAENGQPSEATLAAAMHRYEQIARDPKYAALAERPEFRQVFGNLQRYAAARKVGGHPLRALPPPPTNVAPNVLPR
jgi:lipid-binding SYLF domain-containing protein